METWVIPFIIVVILISFYWGAQWHQREMKKIESECSAKHCGPQERFSGARGGRETLRARKTPQRIITSSIAPPLPLSTMYSIRIGREVTSRGGPGDEIWDYDHSRITGPRY